MRITSENIDQLDENGYTLVTDFLTTDELAACRAEVARYFPTSGEILEAPERYTKLNRFAFFPFAGMMLNHVTTHPEIIGFLERMYGTTELRLGESILQVKYGRRSGAGVDQLLHNDAYGKNSLLYPRDDGIFRHTFMILYYSDVTEELAPTYVVSQQHTRDLFLLTSDRTNARTREDHPELYKLEEPVVATAGSLLIFTARTVHRGSAITAEIGERYAHFITYHAAAATWLESQNWPGSPPNPNAPEMESFIEHAMPRQREMLGFPPPGHPYWNEDTLRGVAARYPGMDMTPYGGSTSVSSAG